MLRILNITLPALLWMSLIFTMSTDIGSGEHTGSILIPLLRWFNPGISDAAINEAHFYVRKCGHLSEYAALGLLLLRSIRLWNGATRWSWKIAGLALLGAAIYAASDEFHQSFVPSRGPSVRDVVIDTCGAFIGLSLAYLWQLCFRSRREIASV